MIISITMHSFKDQLVIEILNRELSVSPYIITIVSAASRLYGFIIRASRDNQSNGGSRDGAMLVSTLQSKHLIIPSCKNTQLIAYRLAIHRCYFNLSYWFIKFDNYTILKKINFHVPRLSSSSVYTFYLPVHRKNVFKNSPIHVMYECSNEMCGNFDIFNCNASKTKSHFLLYKLVTLVLIVIYL